MSQQFGLRVKLYIVICEEHSPESEFGFPQFPKFQDLFGVQTGNTRDICEALAKTALIGYASITVVINTTCKSRSKILRKVLKAIKINPNLRYKLKVILTVYPYDKCACLKNNTEDIIGQYLRSMKMPYPNSVLAYPDGKDSDYNYATSAGEDVEEIITENHKLTCNHMKDIKKDMQNNILADAHYFHRMKLDNAMFKQSLIKGVFVMSHIILDMAFTILHQRENSMKRTLVDVRMTISKIHFVFHSTTNVDLYPFNINPALTIIINNYHFTNPHRTREGSEMDVKRLMRELKIAGISHLVFQDFDRNKLLQLMNCMKNVDCSSLGSLLIAIMSHGGRDDVIHTPDGDVVVIKTDIVEPLQSNSSLKDVNIAIAVSACRGDIDPQWADYNDLKSIQPTDSRHLATNMAIVYSTPNNVTSYRCPKHGSPFVISLCKHIRKYSELRKIVKKINQDLKEETCYEGLEKIPELVTLDPQRQYHFHRYRPEEASKMMQFFETLVKDLTNLQLLTNGGENLGATSQPLFFMGGSFSSNHASEISFTDLYLDPALEAEHCPLDNDSALERCRYECV